MVTGLADHISMFQFLGKYIPWVFVRLLLPFVINQSPVIPLTWPCSSTGRSFIANADRRHSSVTQMQEQATNSGQLPCPWRKRES